MRPALPEDGLLFHQTTTTLASAGQQKLSPRVKSNICPPACRRKQPSIHLTTHLPHFLQGNSPSGPAVPLLPAEGPVLRALTS